MYITEKQSHELVSDLNRLYQLKYFGGIKRIFDSKKLESIIGKINFVEHKVGLRECLGEFLDSDKQFKNINILGVKKLLHEKDEVDSVNTMNTTSCNLLCEI